MSQQIISFSSPSLTLRPHISFMPYQLCSTAVSCTTQISDGHCACCPSAVAADDKIYKLMPCIHNYKNHEEDTPAPGSSLSPWMLPPALSDMVSTRTTVKEKMVLTPLLQTAARCSSDQWLQRQDALAQSSSSPARPQCLS